MGFVKEFKEFAFKGNVIDLAVGVVIGAAFGKIVDSFVKDILTPAILDPLLKAANVQDLDKLFIPGTSIAYGKFLSETISFLLVAFALFVFIKVVNRAKRSKEAAAEAASLTPQPSKEEVLLAEIRDILKQQNN